jgi:hypothetical protein
MMNEEMDLFERHLSRQPLRQVPAQWREEILSAASEVGTARPAVRLSDRAGHAALPGWLEKALWPSPAAWAGLAVIWILIFAVDFSIRDKTPVVAGKSLPPSPEMIAQLRQQQRLLAELMGPRDIRDADRSKSLAPRPRSECVKFLTA